MPTAAPLLDLVAVHGPWLLFLLAILETSFVTGLAVPSGVATSLATAVALERGDSLLPVAAAAAAGGAIGDSLGFWIGRTGRVRWQEGSTRFARQVREMRGQTSRWFGRHPFVSVTLARLISFVRTIMPMTAGMSDIRYTRFLAYDVAGVAAWVALYMTAGIAAELSWTADALGMGAMLSVLGLVAGTVWLVRRRRARGPSPGAGAESV